MTPSPPPIVRCEPRHLACVAELWGDAEEEVRVELAGFPASIEVVVALPDDDRGTPVAAALYVPATASSAGRPSLGRVACDADPRGRAAAERFVTWAEQRAGREGAAVLEVVERRCPGLGTWLEARGYRAVNALIRMRCAAPRPVPPLAPGLRECTVDACGVEPWVRAWNESFAAIPFTGPTTREECERALADPAFDRGLLRIVLRGDEPAGFLRGSLSPTGVGEVQAIGVVPASQGTGLGRWLLRRCEQLLDERGAREIVLRVAETNRTARTLYEREGYAEVSRVRSWERTLGSAPPARAEPQPT